MITVPGYTLFEQMSEGDYSYVYKGVRDKDQQSVILKMLKDPYPSHELVARFKQEYYILKQAGTIPEHCFESSGNCYAIVMENEGAVPLKKYINQGPLALFDFFDIALSIIKSLELIHSRHIIHKDINSANIVWNETTRQASIIDFGLSSLLITEEVEFNNLKEHAGMISYISPEQTGRMNRPVDYRTDFYSLGVVFYEMLAGQLPFQHDDILELIHAHITKTPESICKINPEVPAIVAAIVNKLMAKMAEDRYASIAGIKADLLFCMKEWKKNKKISSFRLAEHDTKDHLCVSQKLYGREKEVIILLNEFERVAQGENKLLFVSGYSGIGKTSLIKEIYKPITQQNGYFISGKFDQLKHATPYSAFVEAFDELIHRLLAEPENILMDLRKRLLATLGEDAELVTQIIPSLNKLLNDMRQRPKDTQKDILQNHFIQAVQRLIRVIAQKEHPLVIMLDDLQWADSASFKLLETLAKDNELNYFFMIGAYRDNEVSIEHPLSIMQEQLENQKIDFTILNVKSLTIHDVYNMLSDSLNAPRTAVLPLADLLFKKTRGNPFFINEFLKMLYRSQLLYFSYTEQQWGWNLEKIEKTMATDNVIDLLVSRIKKLPQDSQHLLKLAACIGHAFNLKTLSIISEKSLSEVNTGLWELLQDSFIIPAGDNYRLAGQLSDSQSESLLAEKIEYHFVHDRVQQAAYQLIPDKEKQDIHLQIGRLLLKERTPTEHDEWLMDILPHFNKSSLLIIDPNEKKQLALYNLWAGKRARKAAAHVLARDYLEMGIDLLREFDLQEKHDVYFELSKELAICLSLLGDVEKAEKLYLHLLTIAKEKLTAIEISTLACDILFLLNKTNEAIKLGLDALKLINIKVPLHPRKYDLLWHIVKIRLIVGRRKPSDIDITPLTSKEHIAVMALIERIFPHAATVDTNLLVLLTFIMIEISLKYGYSANCVFSFIVYSVTLIFRLHQLKRGLEWKDFVLRLKEKFGGHHLTDMRVNTVLAFAIYPLTLPFKKVFDALLENYQLIEKIDYNFAVANLGFAIYVQWMMGHSMTTIKKTTDKLVAYSDKIEQPLFKTVFSLSKYSYECLLSTDYDPACIQQYEAEALASKHVVNIMFSYHHIVRINYLLGRYDDVICYARRAKKYQKSIIGSATNAEYNFYFALSLITTNALKNTSAQHEFKEAYAFIKYWSDANPTNFEHYIFLLDAELARTQKNPLKAMLLYRKVIETCEKKGNFCLVGVASEAATKLYSDLKLTDIAQFYLNNAYNAFMGFGATKKADLIKDSHPDFFTAQLENAFNKKLKTSSSDNALASIDVLSLMRATQIISEEIQLDKLLQKLLVILLQNAGAECGTLVMREGERWFISAQGTVQSQEITLTQIKPMDQSTSIPLSLMRYVQRTQEPIVIQDEIGFQNYLEHDDFLKHSRPKSALVLPIIYQNKMRGLLYVENRTISNAFTPEHVHILQVLSSQAAISIENARLYYQATHDPLTGLANRNLLYQVFNMAARQADHDNSQIAILYFDLDGFKKINDSLGHNVGDKLLFHIGEKIQTIIRGGDLAVRLGGDEFVAMLVNTKPEYIETISHRFLEALKQPITIDGHDVRIGCSVGASFYPKNSRDVAELLKQADIALYRVKSGGKGACQFYSQSMEEHPNGATESRQDVDEGKHESDNSR